MGGQRGEKAGRGGVQREGVPFGAVWLRRQTAAEKAKGRGGGQKGDDEVEGQGEGENSRWLNGRVGASMNAKRGEEGRGNGDAGGTIMKTTTGNNNNNMKNNNDNNNNNMNNNNSDKNNINNNNKHNNNDKNDSNIHGVVLLLQFFEGRGGGS